MAVVEHGDSECRFCDGSEGALGFFGRARDKVPGLAKLLPGVINTGFGIREAMLGDDALVKRSLDRAAMAAGRGGLVEFYSTCAPLLLAGDLSAHARAAAEKHGVRIQLENFNSYSEYSPAKAAARSEFIFRKLSSAKKAGAGKPAYDVFFIGGTRLNGSLSRLLLRAGLRTAPESAGLYSGVLASRLQVLSSRDEALCPALDRAGIKWLAPPSPYGFAGTKAWISSILRALDKKPAAGALPAREQLSELKASAAAARGFSAAFVLSPGEIRLLHGDKLIRGAAMLTEAGLGLRLLVHLADPAGRAVAAKAAASARARFKAGAFGVFFFSSPAELHELLAGRADAKLVYSDIPRDPRILAAGRTPFTDSVFEPGYEGALESARRLLELCERKFDEKYFGV
jgi:hypothetical protein